MGFFSKTQVPNFQYRSEAFDHRFAELVGKGRDLNEAAREASEFADIVARNKQLPEHPPKPMTVLDKGVDIFNKVAQVRKDNPEMWDMLTSIAGGIIGGFTGTSAALAIEEPPQVKIDFNDLK